MIKYKDFMLHRENEQWNSMNEGFNLGSAIKRALKQLVKSSGSRRYKLLTLLIVGILSCNPIQIANLEKDPMVSSLINSELELKAAIMGLFNKPYKFVASQKCWDHIKYEEGSSIRKGEPVLVAYDIGDNSITIGWGHSMRLDESPYKVGDRITREEAKKFLKSDMKIAADGVRRMFKQWEDEGVTVPITQDMFDALVSIAFNVGVGGMRKSDIVEELKKGNYVKAGERINTFKTSNKFPGLVKRRKLESELFLSYREVSSDSDES